jgi:arginase
VASLESGGNDGFWLRLDADVLNDTVMPTVDYRMPGGLTPDALASALTAALRSAKVSA